MTDTTYNYNQTLSIFSSKSFLRQRCDDYNAGARWSNHWNKRWPARITSTGNSKLYVVCVTRLKGTIPGEIVFRKKLGPFARIQRSYTLLKIVVSSEFQLTHVHSISYRGSRLCLVPVREHSFVSCWVLWWFLRIFVHSCLQSEYMIWA